MRAAATRCPPASTIANASFSPWRSASSSAASRRRRATASVSMSARLPTATTARRGSPRPTASAAATRISATTASCACGPGLGAPRVGPQMALSDEIAYLSATELAAQIRARRVSPLEVVDATSERIAARNPSLNALVFEAFDEARDAAREAQRRLATGEATGPFHGVPTATKDLYGFVPGWPATYGGIPALRDHRPPQCALWAERMRRAGAILMGKTNSPVFGFRGTT